MNTYILLFRGINVGGNNIMPMVELRSLLSAQGYEDVKTYIQSGNAIVKSSQKPGKDIITAIQARFGFSPNLMIMTPQELSAAAANNPFTASENKAIHFFFANTEPTPDLKKLETLAAETEEFSVQDRVLYLYTPEGIGRSKLAANLEKCLNVSLTGRNLNTVNKLLTMADGD